MPNASTHFVFPIVGVKNAARELGVSGHSTDICASDSAGEAGEFATEMCEETVRAPAHTNANDIRDGSVAANIVLRTGEFRKKPVKIKNLKLEDAEIAKVWAQLEQDIIAYREDVEPPPPPFRMEYRLF